MFGCKIRANRSWSCNKSISPYGSKYWRQIPEVFSLCLPLSIQSIINFPIELTSPMRILGWHKSWSSPEPIGNHACRAMQALLSRQFSYRVVKFTAPENKDEASGMRRVERSLSTRIKRKNNTKKKQRHIWPPCQNIKQKLTTWNIPHFFFNIPLQYWVTKPLFPTLLSMS